MTEPNPRHSRHPVVFGDHMAAYTDYANMLDREEPGWHLDDIDGMAPGLAALALARRVVKAPQGRISAAGMPSPFTASMPASPVSALAMGAIATYELFKSYVDAGFSRMEALMITMDLLRDAREQHRRENPAT